MSLIDKEIPREILTLSDPANPPKLNEISNRWFILSPTVTSGLEPESSISDFKIEKEVSKCSFNKGSVWKVIHKKTQKVYCMKIYEKEDIIKTNSVPRINREIEIMYLLNHPHCCKLKTHFEDDKNIYLVMPMAEKISINRVLKKFKKFDERTAAQILRETISAVQYMHSLNPPIIHRDIIPENLLINKEGRVLLSDFHFANYTKEDEKRKSFFAVSEYISPEMLSKKDQDIKIDIWSIGVLMFELLFGYTPFNDKNTQELYKNIETLNIKLLNGISPLAKDLIEKILKLNPQERPSLEDILNHQWFKQTKIIKPLLEDKIKNIKELLAFHKLNECGDEIFEKINKLISISEMDKNDNITNNNNNFNIGSAPTPLSLKHDFS